jgi:hypothetical protein
MKMTFERSLAIRPSSTNGLDVTFLIAKVIHHRLKAHELSRWKDLPGIVDPAVKPYNPEGALTFGACHRQLKV